MKIAIIGSGISGSNLAYNLSQTHKANITVFEKSRGFGGRMATRYNDKYSFDHGTQYFTAKSKEFKNFLESFINKGLVKEWSGKFITLSESEKYDRIIYDPRYVCTPKMSSLCRHLIEKSDIEVKQNFKATSIIKDDDNKWKIISEDEDCAGFDLVISTAPAEQCIDIFPKRFAELKTLKKVKMQACFTVMLGFPEIEFKNKFKKIAWNGALIKDSFLGWIAINNSKHGRDKGAYSFVVQSNNVWAEENFDRDSEKIIEEMKNEFFKLLKIDGNTEYESFQKWKYANVEKPAGKDFLFDENLILAACGDWCISGKAESAFLSSLKLSEFIKTKFL